MDVVKKRAEDFLRIKYRASTSSMDFIDKLKLELYNYYRKEDKVKFIEIVFTKMSKDRDEHLKVCKNLDSCRDLRELEDIVFFTQQELEENGVNHKNLFDSIESITVNQKVDELINELKNLRTDIEKIQVGQQITYDDFIEEFETLKKQVYLDKKTWRQVLFGKIIEMIISGIISETLAKRIVEIFGDILPSESLKKLTE